MIPNQIICIFYVWADILKQIYAQTILYEYNLKIEDGM